MKNRIPQQFLTFRWAMLLWLTLLSSCGGDQFAGVGSGGTSKIIVGTVATGAAAVGAVVTIYDAKGQLITAATKTDISGAYQLEIDTLQARPPFLVRAKIGSETYYHALLLSKDGKNHTVNIHQVSEMVSALTLGKDPQSDTAHSTLLGHDLDDRHARAVQDVTSLLAPVAGLKAKIAGQAAKDMVALSLDQPMQANNLGTDALLDAIRVDKSSNSAGQPTYTVKVNAEMASISPVSFNLTPDSVSGALAQVASESYRTQVNSSTSLTSAPVTVLYGETPKQYATLAIWLPTEVKGGWVLSFESANYRATKFAGVFAQETVTTTPDGQKIFQISLSSLDSGTQNPNTVIGLHLASSTSGMADIRNCRFNGSPCAVRAFQTGQTNTSLYTLLQAYGVEHLFNGVVSKVAAVFDKEPPPPPIPEQPANPSPALEVTLELLTEWVGGYGAEFTVKNVSGANIPSQQGWAVSLTLPTGTIESGPWNLDAIDHNGTYTLSPKEWVKAQLFLNQTSVVSGFNGKGCVLSLTHLSEQNPALKIGPKLKKHLEEKTSCPSNDTPLPQTPKPQALLRLRT